MQSVNIYLRSLGLSQNKGDLNKTYLGENQWTRAKSEPLFDARLHPRAGFE